MRYKAKFDEYRSFGIELEVVNCDHARVEFMLREAGVSVQSYSYTHRIVPHWKITTDGSLVGSLTAEIVSPILQGPEGIQEVITVLRVLREAGCRVNRSCGFHVHWNASDFTGKDVQSLLRFYSKFESVIDFLVAKSRRGDLNPYCLTLKKDSTLQWVTDLDPTGRASTLEVVSTFDRNNRSYRGSRFHKVNVQAFPLYGTIEFRQHQGTLNEQKVINWILLTQQLINKAKEVSVAKTPSAKPTFGEFMRSLRLVDHQVDPSSTDPRVVGLHKYYKKRYKSYTKELFQDSEEE